MILPCAGQDPDTGNRRRSHSGKKDRLVRLSVVWREPQCGQGNTGLFLSMRTSFFACYPACPLHKMEKKRMHSIGQL